LVWGGDGKPKCIFCSEEHWSDECKTVVNEIRERSSLSTRTYASIVDVLVIGGPSAVAVVVSRVGQSITPAYM
jgi:Ni,Fe-hydrogenase I small subunit